MDQSGSAESGTLMHNAAPEVQQPANPDDASFSLQDQRQLPHPSRDFFKLEQLATILAVDGVVHQEKLPTRFSLRSHVKCFQVTLKLKSGEEISGVGEGEDRTSARQKKPIPTVLGMMRERGLVGGFPDFYNVPAECGAGAGEGLEEASMKDVAMESVAAGRPEVVRLEVKPDDSSTRSPNLLVSGKLVDSPAQLLFQGPTTATSGLATDAGKTTVVQLPRPGDRFSTTAAFHTACREGLLASQGTTMHIRHSSGSYIDSACSYRRFASARPGSGHCQFKITAVRQPDGDWGVDDERSVWEHDHDERSYEHAVETDESRGEGAIDRDDGDLTASPSSSSRLTLDALLSIGGREAAHAEQRRIGNSLLQSSSQASADAYLATLQTPSTQLYKQERFTSFTNYCTKISVPIFPIAASIVCLWIHDVNHRSFR
ncbi:hypothetical protein RQP46_010481 [Phenoliferia psychrophenolica]